MVAKDKGVGASAPAPIGTHAESVKAEPKLTTSPVWVTAKTAFLLWRGSAVKGEKAGATNIAEGQKFEVDAKTAENLVKDGLVSIGRKGE